MGLIPTYCRLLLRLHKQLGFKGPVLTLGNQDVWASHEQLKQFFREADCEWHEAEVFPHTSKHFRERSEASDFVHARTFFQMMGISEYYDLDKFSIDVPQILHDLNEPVPTELHHKFNLVIDGGTIEHIFDVRQVMENILRMCNQDGWVVHITPSSNYIDHGFYSFSPCFFYDFYRANGFDNFTCYVLQAEPQDFYAKCSLVEYSYGMDLSSFVDPTKISIVFFAAQRVSCSDAISIPIQGSYNSEVDHVGEPATDFGRVSLIERFVPGSIRPLLQPLRPLLGSLRRKVNPVHKQLQKL